MSLRPRHTFSSLFLQRSAFSVRLPAALLAVLFTTQLAAFQTFQPALPGYNYEFPRDHGTHDEYRTEWWYYTGHLRTESGRAYGFEVTFFRVGIRPPGTPQQTRWDLRNLSLAHFAITDIDGKRFRFAEKLNRTSPFTANAAPDHLEVFNEAWKVTTSGADTYRLVAAAGGDAIDLTLRSRKAPVIHGENGISVKAEGAGYASHYYSLTRLEVSGTIAVAGGRRESCKGLAWMDHEFGSSALRETQQGWDWYSVQLDNDTELMLYVIRRRDGFPDRTSSGTIVNSDGTSIHIKAGQFQTTALGRWHSPHSGANYPMGWRLAVPALNLRLELHEALPDQELQTKGSTRVTYWEGAVTVLGSFGGTPVRGQGYVEMTGYDKAFREGK
jgi:predicted secreted hydrolase